MSRYTRPYYIPERNRHRYNQELHVIPHLDFSELIALTLSNSLQEPLYQFTDIIKNNAIKKIVKWYKKIKSKEKIEFVDR
jgi:hypothetical protein